jgi:hypothetical protein
VDFKKITVPTLLFIGDREKISIVTQETAQEAARINDKVRVVQLEGARQIFDEPVLMDMNRR